jgi:biopolymer transport protein ExbB
MALYSSAQHGEMSGAAKKRQNAMKLLSSQGRSIRVPARRIRAALSGAAAALIGANAWCALIATAWAQDAASELPAAVPTIGMGQLPRDLSPWGMFLNADMVVKAVMIGLALASVATWTVWVAKTIEISLAKRKARDSLAVLATAGSLSDARLQMMPAPAGRLLSAAAAEIRLSADAVDKDGLKERIASRLERIEAACTRQINRGTGVLATIGATAPFVGLFGTVWGIMNSFIGISKSHTTNLAIVAPGIAEALLATAIGLFAAIPALVAYNKLQGEVARSQARMESFADEFSAILSRQIDQHAGSSGRDRAA